MGSDTFISGTPALSLELAQLAKQLQEPFDLLLDVRQGELVAQADVFQLVRIVDNPRERAVLLTDRSFTGDRGVALHCLLYHLGAGALGLPAPVADGRQSQLSKAIDNKLTRAAAKFNKEKETKRLAAKRDAAKQREFDDLLTEPFDFGSLVRSLLSPAGNAQPGGGKRVAAAPPDAAASPTAAAAPTVAVPTAAAAKRRRAAADSPAPPAPALAVASPGAAAPLDDSGELCALRAEVARLRAENGQLRAAAAPPRPPACALPLAAAPPPPPLPIPLPDPELPPLAPIHELPMDVVVTTSFEALLELLPPRPASPPRAAHALRMPHTR